MPNWTTNHVTIKADDENKLKEIKEFVKSETSYFDFDKIVPMPQHSEKFFRDGNLGEEEKNKYGKNNWYDWSVENWGTKWNSCDATFVDIIEINDNFELNFYFQTAWNPPIPVIKALAEKFNVKVTCVYNDENIGYDCGKIIFNEKGGVIEDIYYEKDGFNLIAEEYGWDYLYDFGYVYKDGKWIYEEEEEN